MDERRFLEEDFSYFLDQLISGNHFSNSKEGGIAKLAAEVGFDKLSTKQQYVLKEAISYYVQDTCKLCATEVPWTEMYDTQDNGGLCGWCWHMSQKND
jgi:hypothetical protein